jgi:hypothetical protein
MSDITVTFTGGYAIVAIVVLLGAVYVLIRDHFRRKNHVMILTENERAILEEVLEIDIHHRERHLEKFEMKPAPLADALKDLKAVHQRLIDLNPNPRSVK